ncbi:diguanylate cyclase [Bacillus mangrovi]|uniref:Diguanylate cyclase n=1 Tax=Metabacillus mangrovi TaxID=1491830 RepID=A0A7X2SB88_9BACI|nr:diguanylate cyclase [Metabacillus mangrovi]MTH55656.1 diguanylate cyclase [Metabacillus mangrovi]
MEKYKVKLLGNIRTKLKTWFEEAEAIEKEDLYKFLHSLAGTAPTIGYLEIGEIAGRLLMELEQSKTGVWSRESIQVFLSPLLAAAYEADSSGRLDLTAEKEPADGEKDLIMLIDDDPALIMFLKEELEKNQFAVMAFTSPQKALKALFDLDPCCVIMDVHMKGKSGLEILEEFKQYIHFRFIPSIMISVDNSKETRMRSYELDADDFIQKPFEIDEFILRVRRLVKRKKQLRELIMLDELTKVYTRKHLKPAFERVSSQMEREQLPFSAAMIDLDHFKSINDRYGHLTGDHVLSQFAEVLKNNLRTGDLPFRYGGEEFFVLFPRTDHHTAKHVLDRLLEQFEQEVFSSAGETLTVSFSAGISDASACRGFEHTVKAADHALYEAKRMGRARVILAKGNEDVEPVKKAVRFAIVDDDPIIRSVLQDYLRNSSLNSEVSLTVETYKNGAAFLSSGWHLKMPELPSFIILDGVMPELDGVEVLKSIRSLDDQERFTIVMLTGRTSEEDMAEALRLGADDYLTKPFKLKEMESRLLRLIKKVSS